MNISGHAKISRVDDLVCRWVVENSFGVDSSLVCLNHTSQYGFDYGTIREVS